MKQDSLRRFVVELPSLLDFDRVDDIKTNVFRALYYAISNDGHYLDQLFPNISHVELMDLLEKEYPIHPKGTSEFFSGVDQEHQPYSHSKGSACARPFEDGEPVYRCESCGFDSSCVLCVHCFNEDDHVGHNVQMYIASDNNGICDCGDPEAFPSTLRCKSQRFEEAILPLSDDFQEAVGDTLTVVLDYILDVTNFSITMLPFIHDNINKRHSILTSETLSHRSSLPAAKYGVEDKNSKQWYLVLWNDEYHDFNQANNGIMSATGYDQQKAYQLAKLVNQDGRCVLKKASDPTDLLESMDKVEAGGLVASIISARDFMREEIIYYMFEWLHEVLNFNSFARFRECAKSTIASLLLEPDYKFAETLPTTLIEELSIDVPRRCYENGLLYEGQIVNYGHTTLKSDFSIKDLSKPVYQVLDPSPDSLYNSRAQHLLLFSHRFKTSIRKRFQDIIVPPIVTAIVSKTVFCKQYIQLYPQLLTCLAFSDREEHLNICSHLSSQLLTFPTSCQNMLQSDQVGNIVGPLAQIIEEQASIWNYESGYPNFYEPTTTDKSKSRSLYEAISRGLHDVGYVVDETLAPKHFHRLLKRQNLVPLLLLLRNFQGFWTIERKYGEHVEREILDFVVHLQYSIPVLKFAKLVAEAPVKDQDLILSVAELVTNFLFLRKIDQKALGIADFKVSKEAVSFVHPLNSFLSFFFQSHDTEVFIDFWKNLSRPFMSIADISLRSIVLGSQVKVGFWIRNGISVSRQASLYIDSVMADCAYFRDIHLNQIAAVIDDEGSTLYNFLDRWELFSWFVGDVGFNETVYEDRFSAIVEKFVIFLYNLIVDRTPFLNLTRNQRTERTVKRMMCYSLSEAPKSYSKIKERIDPEINSHKNFDEWLEECAEYQSPSSLVDSGMYRLKPELYLTLDPYSVYLDSSRSQEVSDIILKIIAKSPEIMERNVIKPNIIYSGNHYVDDRIARFTKTNYFAKLVYKLLKVAIENKDETYLAPLLHLFHAVLLDGEHEDSQSGVVDCFVDIPIGDLLMSITESTLSKHLVAKADYLLNMLITKDQRVVDSLVNCFGKEHIDNYIKKKSGSIESVKNKSKRLASQRAAKVMKKFAMQRKKFLDQNSDLNFENLKPEPETNIELRNCVLCGDRESTDEIFGILGNTLNSSILWKIPPDDPTAIKAAFTRYDDADKSDDAVYGTGFRYPKGPLSPGNPSEYRTLNSKKYDAFVASSCSHGMHYTCFKRLSGRSSIFPCPLCHTIQNIFIPSFLPPSQKSGLTIDELNSEPIVNKYNQILNSSSENKSSLLIERFFNEKFTESSYLALRRNLEAFSEDFNLKLKKGNFLAGSNQKIEYINTLCKLSTLVADTIRMNEITTRLNGKEGYANFVEAIPATTKTLLKSLIQCRALLYELREMPNLLGSSSDLQQCIEKFWSSEYLIDGVFNEVVMLFFQTDESFRTLAYVGFIKMFTLCFYSVALRCKSSFFLNQIKEISRISLDDDLVRGLDVIFDRGRSLVIEYAVEEKKADFLTSIYHAVEKCMVPFLKQLIIFKDVLTSTNEGDNNHISIPDIQDLPGEIRAQGRLDCVDALCQNLQLPTLKELVGLISKDEGFEFKTFDVILNAKIPKYFESGVLTLDFPGTVKLIDLPKDYISCILNHNKKGRSGTYDNYICLHCGAQLSTNRYYKHTRKCSSSTCVFFHPSKNNIRVVTHVGGGQVTLLMPGPYLTAHGEVKNPVSTEKATLNQFRYNELNKSWLNQGLYSFVTRTLYGSRQTNVEGVFVPPTTGVNNLNFANAETNLDEESSEDEYEDFFAPFAW